MRILPTFARVIMISSRVAGVSGWVSERFTHSPVNNRMEICCSLRGAIGWPMWSRV